MLAAEFKKIETAWTFRQYVTAMTAAVQKAHTTKDLSDVNALVNGTALASPPL